MRSPLSRPTRKTFVTMLALASSAVFVRPQRILAAKPDSGSVAIEGYGRGATGGTGGRIVYVTHGGDDGPGSLRDALLGQTGPRIVVFKVRTVTLNSVMRMGYDNGNVSVYGQSAGGVTVKRFPIDLRGSNILFQGMRMRVGADPGIDSNGDFNDSLNCRNRSNAPMRDIVIDHCSVTWGLDETLSFGIGGKGSGADITDVTISNCIIGQPLTGTPDRSGAPGRVLFFQGGRAGMFRRISVLRNLICYGVDRMPWFKHGDEIEFANNHIYGSGHYYRFVAKFNNRGSDDVIRHMRVNCESNHFALCPEIPVMKGGMGWWVDIDAPAGNGSYYIAEDNLFEDDIGVPTRHRIYHSRQGAFPDISRTVPAFAPGSGYARLPVSEVRAHVLLNAGARCPDLDAADSAIVDNVINRRNGLAATVADTPGWDARPFTPLEDSDGDGIPDKYADRYATVESYMDAILRGEASPEG